MSWPDISVVIVSYNGVDYLRECLESLYAQTVAGRTEIIVIDNGSTDGSRDILLSQGDRLRLILNQSNLGFATACNQGFAASRSELVAILNDDAIADPAWLENLAAAIKSAEDIGSCATKVLSAADNAIIDNVGHVVFPDGLTRGRGRMERDGGQYETREEVFCASGAAAMFRRAMLDDVGVFDDAFFAYCEDADLGFRARLKRWRCIYEPRAIVYHRFSASTNPYSAFKAFHVERNRVWLAVKNLPLPLLTLSLGYTFARYFWQAYGAFSGKGASGLFASQNSRGELTLILLRAYLHALRGLPRAVRQRTAIQKSRRVTSSELRRCFREFGISARQIALMN